MKRILITGNSGYIGSHLTKLLNAAGCFSVSGLDRNQPAIPVDTFYAADITTLCEADMIGIEFDCVIHLAALVSVAESTINPVAYYTTNVSGTLNILRHIKTSHYILASTGAADNLESPYGLSKKMAEDISIQHCIENDIQFTIFRFYNVIGCDGITPTNPDGLFYSLMNARTSGNFTIFGNDYNTFDGTCIRDYTHVNEICNSIISVIKNPTNQIENLGHGIGISVNQIVETFKMVNSVEFKVSVGNRRPGDIEYSVLSNPSKHMKQLYTLEELLRIPHGT
jgi:UDP-glucose 4-epimerase